MPAVETEPGTVYHVDLATESYQSIDGQYDNEELRTFISKVLPLVFIPISTRFSIAGMLLSKYCSFLDCEYLIF